MLIYYRKKRPERILIAVNTLAAAFVVATFVCLFGFAEPLLPARLLYALQVVLLCIFVAEKVIRRFNAVSKTEFWRANWMEVPLLFGLGAAMFAATWWLPESRGAAVRHVAVSVYLVLQVVTKVCRTTVGLAASGKSPAQTLIASFIVLILAGAGLLMLPRASTRLADGGSTSQNLSFVDALFVSTSASCVTGLVIKDIGKDYTLMGQIVILTLIQLGGLGIVIFGAVLALLLGQALSVRESAAMQDLLSEGTLSRIGNMIVFVFVATVLIESVSALGLSGMWDNVPGRITDVHQKWFCSVFHSISAFCNAGFTLFSDNLVGYSRSWGVYLVICPLIVLGGLGFGVLYDVLNMAGDRLKRLWGRSFSRNCRVLTQAPEKMGLQTKLVLCVTACLIVFGTLGLLLFERFAGQSESAKSFGVLDALFQSVTARTAGFNTVDIGALSSASQFVLILLMFIGGSPGGTAGGIKTVTLAVVIMAVVATLRRRDEVEVFKRSVRWIIVQRAITVTVLFIVVLFGATLALSITENASRFSMMQIIFEVASALGTVGLSTGITPSLTSVGKLIIIIVMLVGRLGPLTLLAALTFDLRTARYNYPEEAIIVG